MADAEVPLTATSRALRSATVVVRIMSFLESRDLASVARTSKAFARQLHADACWRSHPEVHDALRSTPRYSGLSAAQVAPVALGVWRSFAHAGTRLSPEATPVEQRRYWTSHALVSAGIPPRAAGDPPLAVATPLALSSVRALVPWVHRLLSSANLSMSEMEAVDGEAARATHSVPRMSVAVRSFPGRLELRWPQAAERYLTPTSAATHLGADGSASAAGGSDVRMPDGSHGESGLVVVIPLCRNASRAALSETHLVYTSASNLEVFIVDLDRLSPIDALPKQSAGGNYDSAFEFMAGRATEPMPYVLQHRSASPHDSAITAITLTQTTTPDSPALAVTASYDHTVCVIDLTTAQCLQRLHGHQDVVWSVTAVDAVSCLSEHQKHREQLGDWSNTSTSLDVRDRRSSATAGRSAHGTFTPPTGRDGGASPARDGPPAIGGASGAAAGGATGGLGTWESEEPAGAGAGADEDTREGLLDDLEPTPHPAFTGRCSPEATGRLRRLVVASGDALGGVILWDVAEGTPLWYRQLHVGQVTGLSVDPVSDWLASAGYMDGYASVWHVPHLAPQVARTSRPSSAASPSPDQRAGGHPVGELARAGLPGVHAGAPSLARHLLVPPAAVPDAAGAEGDVGHHCTGLVADWRGGVVALTRRTGSTMHPTMETGLFVAGTGKCLLSLTGTVPPYMGPGADGHGAASARLELDDGPAFLRGTRLVLPVRGVGWEAEGEVVLGVGGAALRAQQRRARRDRTESGCVVM